MIRFEVHVNGEKVCTAGLDDEGVLTTIITFAARTEQSYDEHRKRCKTEGVEPPSREEWLERKLDLSVGGLGAPSDQHLDWVRRNLSEGDTVSVKILGPGEFDEPKRRHLVGCKEEA